MSSNYELNRKNISNGAFAAYVANKGMYSRTTFRIREDGSTCWLLDGNEIDDKDFKNLYPIGLINKTKGTRLDSRQNIF